MSNPNKSASASASGGGGSDKLCSGGGGGGSNKNTSSSGGGFYGDCTPQSDSFMSHQSYQFVDSDDEPACKVAKMAEVKPVQFHYLREAPPERVDIVGRHTVSYQSACQGEKMEALIENTAGILEISPDEAVILLAQKMWCLDMALEFWTSDVGAARSALGISARSDPPPELAEARRAGVMLSDDVFLGDPFEPLQAEGAACGHLFSMDAWRAQLRSTLKSAPLQALQQKCILFPECKEVVRPRVWRSCLEGNEFDGYVREMIRSYANASRTSKACLHPGCDLIVELRSDLVAASTTSEVTCANGHSFCFHCFQPPHSPVSCKNAKIWNDRDVVFADQLNSQWVASHTKNCPKCKNPIEKNEGCNHVTCRHIAMKGGKPCGHEFCWQCFAPWRQHEGACVHSSLYEFLYSSLSSPFFSESCPSSLM